MKTIEEKATEFAELMLGDYPDVFFNQDFKARMIKLLKEQDREIRRACAQSAEEVWPRTDSGGLRAGYSDVFSAIMNTNP